MFNFLHSIIIGLVSATTAFTGAFYHSPQIPPAVAEQATTSVESSPQTALVSSTLTQPSKEVRKSSPTKTYVQSSSSAVDAQNSITASQPEAPKQTFTTPSGAVISADGNIISAPQQPTTPMAPANSMLCNGTYYSFCPSGQNFVCPSNGAGAYCQPQQQNSPSVQQNYQQVQDQATAQQQKTNQVNALVAEYNSQKNALEQQILDIKTKYYNDKVAASLSGSPLSFVSGRIERLTDDANTQIQKIQLQEQQLYLDYLVKTAAVQ